MSNLRTTIFIAGSTRGVHADVRTRFLKIAEELMKKGYRPIIPTVIAEPTANWNDSIRSDISHLMACEEIHLIHGWQGHKRSEILRDIALRIGIKAVYH